MVSSVTQLVATYGYVIVALLIMLESAGLPLPGETALLVAAAYAGRGQLSITGVIAVAALAAILGDAAGYWIGQRGGRPFLERYGKWLRLDAQKISRIDAFFVRHGPKTVFFGRFFGLLRTYSALFAGISKMPYRTFTLFNALGGILWAILFGLLGYVFGQHLSVIERLAAAVGWAVLVLIGVLLCAVLVWSWIATHQAQLLARRDALLSYPPLAWFRVRYARELQWVRNRLTPGAYLGLHVTLGLLAAAGCLWLFGGVLQDVLAHDPLIGLNQIVATTLHSWATPSATILFVLISDLGAPFLFVLSVIVAVFFSWRRQWLYLAGWLVALGGGELLSLVIRQLVARPGPVFFQPLLPASDYSFPSSQAVLSLIAYGLLAYFAVLGLRTWRARTAVICAAMVLVLVIGFSRLYLGMEYLSDVAGGYAAGGVWLSTCITGMELIRRGEITARWIQRLQRWKGQDRLI